MNFFILVPYYLSWHYTRGVTGLLSLWKRFMWFNFYFFSVPVLLKTLFSPFQRLQEQYKGGLDIEDMFSVLIVNTVMRFFGFIIRSTIIVMSLVSFLVIFFGGALFFIIWLVLPLALVFLIFASLLALIIGIPASFLTKKP